MPAPVTRTADSIPFRLQKALLCGLLGLRGVQVFWFGAPHIGGHGQGGLIEGSAPRGCDRHTPAAVCFLPDVLDTHRAKFELDGFLGRFFTASTAPINGRDEYHTEGV